MSIYFSGEMKNKQKLKVNVSCALTESSAESKGKESLLHRRHNTYSESKNDEEKFIHGHKTRCGGTSCDRKWYRHMHRGMREYENIGFRNWQQ